MCNRCKIHVNVLGVDFLIYSFYCSYKLFLFFPVLQSPMESEFNTTDRPTNFSNPMYDSYGEMPSGGSGGSKRKGFHFSTSSPGKSPFPSSDTSAPPFCDTPELDETVPPSSFDGNQSSNGFNPTSVDTDKDTQALVEEDDE